MEELHENAVNVLLLTPRACTAVRACSALPSSMRGYPQVLADKILASFERCWRCSMLKVKMRMPPLLASSELAFEFAPQGVGRLLTSMWLGSAPRQEVGAEQHFGGGEVELWAREALRANRSVPGALI
jgi:hypothetical protein